jgi:ferredoxin
MKVSIDKTKCASCMSCVAICPEVFEMTDSGYVDVKKEFQGVDITDEALTAKIKEAAMGCPSTAIVIEQ